MPANDIELSVGLNTQNAQKEAQQLSKQINEALKSSSGDSDSRVVKANEQLKQAQTNAQGLLDKMEKLSKTKVYDEDWIALNDEISKIERQIDSLIDKEEKFIATGGDTKSRAFQNYEYDIEKLHEELKELYETRDRLKAQGDIFTEGVNTQEYQELNAQLDAANDKMKIALVNQQQLMGQGTDLSGIVADVKGELAGITSSIAAVAVPIGIVTTAAKTIFSLAKKIFGVAKKIFSTVVEIGKKLAGTVINAIRNIRNMFRSSSGSITDMLKRVVSLSFGLNGLANVARRLRSALTGAFETFMQAAPYAQVTQQINNLKSSLATLKLSFAAAFSPIVSAVIPYLQSLISWLAKAIGYIGQFFAALTGKSTYTSAVSAGGGASGGGGGGSKGKTAQQKYEEAVAKAQLQYEKELARYEKQVAKQEEQQAKAAAKLAKEQEKANKQLANFDELNVLTSQDMDDLADSYEELEKPELELPDMADFEDDIAGGAGGGLGAAFEELPVSDWIKDLIDKIKEAWKNADFFDIGRMLGEKLAEALRQAYIFITSKVIPFMEKLGKSIATFLNGFFTTPGLAAWLGKTIGALINAALALANNFLDNTNFRNIGKFIGTALMNIFNEVDFDGIGHYFAQKLNALFDIIGGFADTTSGTFVGDKIARAINKFIKDFKWKENGESLSAFMQDLLTALAEAAEKVNWDELGQGIVDFISGIWDDGKLLESVDRLVDALIDAFKTLKDKIPKDKVVSVFKDILGKMSEWIIELLEGEDLTWVGDTIAELLGAVDWSGILLALADTLGIDWKAIAEKILFDFIPSVVAFITGHYNEVNVAGEGMTDALREGFFAKVPDFLQKLGQFISDIKTNFNTMRDNIKTVIDNIKTHFQNFKADVITIVENIKNSIKGKINGIIGIFENMINAIVDGINILIDGINSLQIPDWVPLIGGESANISRLSSVSLPRLATGQVIPPNVSEYLAILGDNNEETEVVSPLSTMKQAMIEALATANIGNNGNNVPIIVQIDGREVFRVVRDQNDIYYNQTGMSAFA